MEIICCQTSLHFPIQPCALSASELNMWFLTCLMLPHTCLDFWNCSYMAPRVSPSSPPQIHPSIHPCRWRSRDQNPVADPDNSSTDSAVRILVFQIQHLIRFLSYIVFKFLDGSLKIQGYKEIQVGVMIMMIMFIHTILGFSECTQRCQIMSFWTGQNLEVSF